LLLFSVNVWKILTVDKTYDKDKKNKLKNMAIHVIKYDLVFCQVSEICFLMGKIFLFAQTFFIYLETKQSQKITLFIRIDHTVWIHSVNKARQISYPPTEIERGAWKPSYMFCNLLLRNISSCFSKNISLFEIEPLESFYLYWKCERLFWHKNCKFVFIKLCLLECTHL